MSWELFVGLRYLRSRRWRFGLSLISTISLVGVMIGVATLIIVLAVMAGLEDELRQKILGFNPHVTVVSYGGPISEWREKVSPEDGTPEPSGRLGRGVLRGPELLPLA